MPFFGDTLGAYMLPRVVLELLQQPGGHQRCGVCGSSGFAWLLSDQQLFVWRYREGKEARLRMLTVPNQPAQPCTVTLLADRRSPASSGSSTISPTALGGFISPPGSAIASTGPAAADGSLTVAVCDANGRLTVWLDAHHLAAPVEHQLLIPSSSVAAMDGSSQQLVSAFAAARVDLGPGPAFIAAVSPTDGSLHLVQVCSQGIFRKQLVAPSVPTSESRGLVGALGRSLTRVFEPGPRHLRRTPTSRPAIALHLAPSEGGGGQHYQLLVLTQDCLDCWAISMGLRPSETLQWSFANCQVRQHEGMRSNGNSSSSNLGSMVNLDLAVAPEGGGQHVAVWMAEADGRAGPAGAVGGGEVGQYSQHVVQLLKDLNQESGPSVCSGVHGLVRGYEESVDGGGPPLRRLLYSSQSRTCLMVRWQQLPAPQPPANALRLQHFPHHNAVTEPTSARVCRALWTLDATSGTATSLYDDPDTSAVDVAANDAVQGTGARWVVLSATYGVIEIAAVSALLAAEPGAAALTSTSSGGLDLAAVISNLLDAVLSQAAAITTAGGNLQPLVSGLGRRLSALGALHSPTGQSSLAHYSTQLLDLLPKQWAAGSAAAVVVGGATGGGGGPLTVAEQLADKEFRHSLLLQCLALSGVLHALDPEVLRVLIENTEKLAVVVALHRLQAHQRDTHVAGRGTGDEDAGAEGDVRQWRGSGDGDGTAAAVLLSRLVVEAGQASSASENEVLSFSEIFYARPSASVVHFLGAIARTAAAVSAQAARGLGNRGDSDLASLRTTVRELGSLVSLLVSAAAGRGEHLAVAHHLSSQDVAARLGRPSWLAGPDTRAALEQLARAVQVVRPAPPAAPTPELSQTLYVVTDVLLTSFSSAAAAMAQRDVPARTALLAAYRDVRAQLSWELLEDAKAELKATGWGGSESGGRVGPLPPDLLMCQLEGLFRAHHCYPQLFDVCEALAAADPALAPRMYTHMATMPPESPADPSAPSMAQYVFQRLLADGRPADLLAMPQHFHAGITAFLQSLQPAASDLLAVHLMREGALGDAAALLMQTAGAAAAAAASTAAGDHGAAVRKQPHPHLAARVGPVVGSLGSQRRLLSLARLAARATGATAMEAQAARQLKLMSLQARLGLNAEGGPLEPAIVLDEALALAAGPARTETISATTKDGFSEAAAFARQAAVVAVEVLVLMVPEVRQAHVSKWQLAWKATYDADSWDELAAARVEGAGEQQWLEALSDTAVCRAARACVRSETLGFGANVVDSAPLDQVARWLRSWAMAGGGAAAQQPACNGAGDGQSHARVERRQAAVMMALRLGVEGRVTVGTQTHSNVGGRAAGSGQMDTTA